MTIGSVRRYFGQLVASYPLVGVVALLLFPLLSLTGWSGNHPNRIHFGGYTALSCALLAGPIVGWMAGKGEPRLIPSGRWIWVLPLAFIVRDLARSFEVNDVPWLPDTLFATGSNEGLTVFLFTLPAFSAIGYSIGIALAGLEIRIEAGLVLIPLFVLSALGAHKFEVSRVRLWHDVRFVIDPQGLRFFQQSDDAVFGRRGIVAVERDGGR